jgi:ferric-chelate reductase (NADPH)
MIGDLLSKLLLKQTTVAAVRDLTPHFRIVSLQGDSLKAVSAAPGNKVQVRVGEPLVLRTYTPLSVNPRLGAMDLLVYVHDDETAAGRWARSLRVSDPVGLFGPRRSLGLEALDGDAVLFGDETSFAVARGWQLQRGAQGGLRFVFEITDRAESLEVLAAIGLEQAEVIENGDFSAVETAVRAALGQDAERRLVLTGQARSIQALRSALKSRPNAHRSQSVKAYWARGKKGLD